jgi:hypothetical protein
MRTFISFVSYGEMKRNVSGGREYLWQKSLYFSHTTVYNMPTSDDMSVSVINCNYIQAIG